MAHSSQWIASWSGGQGEHSRHSFGPDELMYKNHPTEHDPQTVSWVAEQSDVVMRAGRQVVHALQILPSWVTALYVCSGHSTQRVSVEFVQRSLTPSPSWQSEQHFLTAVSKYCSSWQFCPCNTSTCNISSTSSSQFMWVNHTSLGSPLASYRLMRLESGLQAVNRWCRIGVAIITRIWPPSGIFQVTLWRCPDFRGRVG